jgi:hypothetical protein
MYAASLMNGFKVLIEAARASVCDPSPVLKNRFACLLAFSCGHTSLHGYHGNGHSHNTIVSDRTGPRWPVLPKGVGEGLISGFAPLPHTLITN